LILEELVTITV